MSAEFYGNQKSISGRLMKFDTKHHLRDETIYYETLSDLKNRIIGNFWNDFKYNQTIIIILKHVIYIASILIKIRILNVSLSYICARSHHSRVIRASCICQLKWFTCARCRPCRFEDVDVDVRRRGACAFDAVHPRTYQTIMKLLVLLPYISYNFIALVLNCDLKTLYNAYIINKIKLGYAHDIYKLIEFNTQPYCWEN